MLALAPLLLALPALQDPVVERKGVHFRVVSHHALGKLADEALQAAEAAWPLALEALDLKEKRLGEPLVIHLHPDAASYEAAEQALTGGAFKTNVAFSHFASKSTHVALQPPCSPQALMELGLPTLTTYLIAHEACHLVSYAYQPNALDFPEWFAEGAAVHVGVHAMIALGRMRAGEAEPLNARYAVLCKQLLEDQKLPAAERVLAAEIGDLEFFSRYAVNVRFYELLLTEHAKDLEKAVKAIKGETAGEAYRAGLRAELGRLWRPKELEKLHEEWLASIERAQPGWDEVERALETRGENYLQRAADSNAVAFHTAALTSLPFTAAGSVRAVPGFAHQMNFLLGRSDKGFLSVAFTFGHGVTLFRCDYGQPAVWTVLGMAECKDLKIGADVPFRIEVSAAELVVFVDGAEALRASLQGRSPLGQWGLGAQAKSTGEWKSLEVEAGS